MDLPPVRATFPRVTLGDCTIPFHERAVQRYAALEEPPPPVARQLLEENVAVQGDEKAAHVAL